MSQKPIYLHKNRNAEVVELPTGTSYWDMLNVLITQCLNGKLNYLYDRGLKVRRSTKESTRYTENGWKWYLKAHIFSSVTCFGETKHQPRATGSPQTLACWFSFA